MRSEIIRRSAPDYKEIIRVFRDAFPRRERFPDWWIMFVSRREGNDFRAYYDEEMLVGISCTFSTDRTCFVLYLAVDKALRSRGYGRKILEDIRARNTGKCIVLCAEYENENATDYEDRVRRIEFYERNGIVPTGYYYEEINEKFEVLADTEGFDPADCQKAMHRICRIKPGPYIKEKPNANRTCSDVC